MEARISKRAFKLTFTRSRPIRLYTQDGSARYWKMSLREESK
jgi:hypothetical protein